jgi:hypothetical protein
VEAPDFTGPLQMRVSEAVDEVIGKVKQQHAL